MGYIVVMNQTDKAPGDELPELPADAELIVKEALQKAIESQSVEDLESAITIADGMAGYDRGNSKDYNDAVQLLTELQSGQMDADLVAVVKEALKTAIESRKIA